MVAVILIFICVLEVCLSEELVGVHIVVVLHYSLSSGKMEPGPSVDDIRFTANTPEVEEAFKEAIRIFGLEKFCQANSIEERFSYLRRYSKELAPTNTSAPPNCLLLDVIGDGDCFWYTILSLLLGRVIKKDEPVVSVMKKNFTSLVIQHKDKLHFQDANPQGTQRRGNLITFNHQSYVNCCAPYKVNKLDECHNRSFGVLRNSDLGNLKYETVEEWCKIVEMPHTWATDDVLRFFSSLTGFTILTHNYRCGPIHPPYYSYRSASQYGFQKPIHGGEILIQWTNSNHYQLLIPKYPNQLETTVRPYLKKPRIEKTVFVDKVNNNQSKNAHSLRDFLEKAKNSRIEKEKQESNADGEKFQKVGKSQKKMKQSRQKVKKAAKAFEKEERMESLKQFDIERNKLRDDERKKENDSTFGKDSNGNFKKGGTKSKSGDSVKKEEEQSSRFNVKNDNSVEKTAEESGHDSSAFDQPGVCEFRILAWCAGRKTCTLKHFDISSNEGRLALSAGKKGLKRKQKVSDELKLNKKPSKLSKIDKSISDINGEDLKTAGPKVLKPVGEKYFKTVNGKEADTGDGEDSKTLKNVDKSYTTGDQVEDIEIKDKSNDSFSGINGEDLKTVDGTDIKTVNGKDLKAYEEVSKTSRNKDKNEITEDQVEDKEIKKESTGNESLKKHKSKNKKAAIFSDTDDSNSETTFKETDQEDIIEKKAKIENESDETNLNLSCSQQESSSDLNDLPDMNLHRRDNDNNCYKEASNSKNQKKSTCRKPYPKDQKQKQKTLEHFFAKKYDESKPKHDDKNMCEGEGRDDLKKETDAAEVGDKIDEPNEGRDDLKKETDAAVVGDKINEASEGRDDLKKETDPMEVGDTIDEPEEKEEDKIDEPPEEKEADNTEDKNHKISKRVHDNVWIEQLVYKHRGNLEKVEFNGKVKLRCIPCNACYKGQTYKAKMYNWAHGLEDCRTWERYKDHETSAVHATALVRRKSTEKGKAQFKKAMETVKAKEKSDYVGKNIEEMLQCKNVLRNLFSTVKQHQSTRSLYSRLGCQDFHFLDLYEAAQAKLEMAESLYESQATDFRKEELIKLQQLRDALPALKQLVGESQADSYKNRSVKVRNMKLEAGEQIYSNIMAKVLNGIMHTFSSDGVEDVSVRHAVNMFLQSETENKGVTIAYFGRIEYAMESMNHVGESKLLLHLLNHCLPGFPGYIFGGTMDGPNVHFGLKNSVSTELQIPLTRDFSHCSALVVTHGTKALPELLQIRELLEDLGRELRNSYQKIMELRAIFLSLNEDITELELCPATRWVFLRKAGIKLIKIYFEIVTFFENRAERHLYGEQADPTAIGRLRHLKDLKFVAALYTSMDFLEPLILLNTRTQGPNRLICEKRHDVQLTTTKLKVLKTMRGTYEKELICQLDFTEDYPKLVLEKGEVQLRKMTGHVMRNKRSDTLEKEVSTKSQLENFIQEYKVRAIDRLLSEIDGCMFKDSLANNFGVFDILDMPLVPEREEGLETDFGQADISALGDYFGNQHMVLRSFKDCSSKNGFMIKPVLQDPVLNKDELSLEFASARGEIVRTYRAAVLKSDRLTKMFENEDNGDSSQAEYFNQKMAYEDFVRQYDGEFPNLSTLIRHMLAHIPNAVACERNASNLKMTLTKTRNRLEYDTLNSEMQITENGPELFTDESELLLSNVATAVLEGGFTSPNYKPKLQFMKNVVSIIDE